MPSEHRQFHHQRWRRVLASARWRLAVHGLAAWCAVAGVVGLLALVTLVGAEAPRWVRLGLLVAGGVLVASSAWSLLLPPWRRLRSRTRLALVLDRAGGFHDTLAAADEVLRQPERWSADTPVRQALRERLLARSARLLGDLSLPRLLPVARPTLVFVVLATVLLVGWWLTDHSPHLVTEGVERAGRVWAGTPAPVGGLRLAHGVDHVVAGQSATVAALDLVAAENEPLICEVRQGTGTWRSLPARRVPVLGDDPTLPDPYQRWEAELRDVREDLDYRFRRGGRVSPVGHLAVWRPPLLTELAARVTPPAYTGLPVRHLDRLPAYLEAPQGSRLHLSGRASSRLVAAALVEDSLTTSLVVAEQDLTGELLLNEPRRFRIHLRDDRGLEGEGDLTHEVTVIPDRSPLVRLQRPDDDGLLPLAAPLRLLASAEDDFGLVTVDLLLRRGDADGGAWVDDFSGGTNSGADGWQRVALLQSAGVPKLGRHEVNVSLGTLPLVIRADGAGDEGLVSLELTLTAAGLALVPGDVLELALEAMDTRQPPPAGVTRSAILRLQVPSSLDLLEARDEAAGEHRADLAEMRRQASDLGAQLERLRRELLKDPSLDWDRRQELQAALQQQEAMQAETQRLAEALGRDLEELAENRLTSPELLEKMDRIEDLLSAHQDQSLENLLETLRQSLDQLSPKELNRAMEELAREQNELRRRLDTAMNMLDDLAREQEMEGLTSMVAQMLSEQQELAEASREQAEGSQDDQGAEESGEPHSEADTGESDEEEETGESGDTESGAESGENEAGDENAANEDLARRQESLAEELDDLEQRLADALDELSEAERDGDLSAAEQEMQDALSEALEQLKQEQTQQTMTDAGESLQQDQSQQATEQMEQALNDLAGLYHVMLRTQMAMQMAMQAEQAGQMRDVAADLLVLSQRQEEVGQSVPRSLRDVRADDLSRRQFEVVQGTVAVRDALGDVAGAAPQEIMRMLRRLDGLIETQGRVLDQLKERRSRAARVAATSALTGMNEVVINLLTQAQQNGQGSGSAQQQSMSQQLGQMSEQQSGLNSLAEQMRRKQGRISQELRAGMQRLQQGQQGLAGQARRLAEEQQRAEARGDTGRLLGDLEQLAEDMERVGDDVAGGLITNETMRRQERILSRLLDMQNASRERDWARRRESRAADEVYAEQLGETGGDEDDLDPEARRWRAVDEAPPAYRDLVRRYFREIQRLHQDAGRLDDGRAVPREGGGL